VLSVFARPLQFTFLVGFTSIATMTSAQFQWGIGVAPGISIAKLGEHEADFAYQPVYSLSPQIFGAYSWNKKYSLFFKTALLQYGLSKVEFQLIGSIRKPINRKLSAKGALGIGAYFLDLGQSDLHRYNDNVYLIFQAGPHFVVPGKFHFLFLALDYHYGLSQEYNFLLSGLHSSVRKNAVYGRGSYLALNTEIIFGKEEQKKKKFSSHKKFPKHFVM